MSDGRAGRSASPSRAFWRHLGVDSYFRPTRGLAQPVVSSIVRDELRAFFRVPADQRPASAPRAPWLVVALVAIAIVEGLVREDLAMRPLQIAVGIALAIAVGFRRSRPLAATVTAFGLCIVTTGAEKALRLPPISLHMSVCTLLVPYSLVRWSSGRDIALGHAVMVGAYLTAAISGAMADLSVYIGGGVTLLLPGAIGAAVRFRAQAHGRDIEHVKLRERADIARDLHDSVAHHVSAIAIQAQAGRAVLAARPESAARALEAIESEAARTLSELRSMVGALRDDQGASLEPQLGVADIERLASPEGRPVVAIELGRGLAALRPAVQSALYRMAQESITNARRHARGATRVHVRIGIEAGKVRLTVQDDGAAPRGRASTGFGLVGMAERAALLAGTLEAGPCSGGGWKVDALLPDDGESPR